MSWLLSYSMLLTTMPLCRGVLSVSLLLSHFFPHYVGASSKAGVKCQSGKIVLRVEQKVRTPLPVDARDAIIVTSHVWGWRRTALGLRLGHHCLLRPAEMAGNV